MTALRVLDVEKDKCILFNSFEKRISNVCPKHVGNVAKRVHNGEAIDTAIRAEKLSSDEERRTREVIAYVSGTMMPETRPFDMSQNAFYKTLVLCPASACNLHCIYCSGSANDKSTSGMSWEVAKAAIDFFFDHVAVPGPYTLQFHGAGEPTSNFKLLMQSIEYAREVAADKGETVLVRLTTNGLMPKKSALWLAEHADHITLSIDGPKDIHDLQRPMFGGAGSYETVVETLQILDQKGIVKRLNTVVTPYGLERMEEILRHIRSLCSVEEIRVLPMSYCGRCEVNEIPKLDMKAFETAYDAVLPVAAELGFKVKSYVEQFEYYTEFYCGACGFNMVVAPNGNVSTCVEVLDDTDAGASELIIGRYMAETQQFDMDWEKVQALRQRTYKTLEPCNSCTFKTNCSGSCLVRAARENGTVMSVDSESCAMVKKTLGALVQDAAMSATAQPEPQRSRPQAQDSFLAMLEASRRVNYQFDAVQQRPWGVEGGMIELMKQVGDLSKHVMTFESYYTNDRQQHANYASNLENIGNELADILHAVIRIADHYNIDLMDMHYQARHSEQGYIDWLHQSGYVQREMR